MWEKVVAIKDETLTMYLTTNQRVLATHTQGF